jgi:hypothetical protein
MCADAIPQPAIVTGIFMAFFIEQMQELCFEI